MKVAIVGSGTMGLGIAQAFAQAPGDYEVIVCVVSGKGFDAKKEKFMAPLNKQVKKGKITQERMDNIMSRVTFTTIDGAADCDLMIESALEDMTSKIDLLRKLDAICPKNVMFATNTSSLSITELSAALSRPVVGMHFFNPAAVMKLIEVIPGMTTTQTMLDTVIQLSKDIGKTPVQVIEGPGFVVNRLLIPMINDAIQIFEEGLATVDGIDTAMKLGANHPMGPLELGDLIGLDVCLAIMETMYHETFDARYRPARLLKKMVRAKMLGQKTSKGFYAYENGRMISGSAHNGTYWLAK